MNSGHTSTAVIEECGRQSIDTQLLAKLSKILDYNFFKLYVNSSHLIEKSEFINVIKTKDEEVKNLKQNIKIKENEIIYLKKIIKLLEQKSKK
jgi:hypothetical protein